MDPEFHITSARLYISHLQASNDGHCEFLATLWNTPEFIKACGKTKVRTLEDARKQIEGWVNETHKKFGHGIYLVSLKPASNGTTESDIKLSFQETLRSCKHIGTVSLMRGDAPNSPTAPDVGFAILPEEYRNGYAREAAQALMDYAEKDLGVRDVIGLFDPENEASKGVFRSLGFQDCGVQKVDLFGGVMSAIWIREGMSRDLRLYNL